MVAGFRGARIPESTMSWWSEGPAIPQCARRLRNHLSVFLAGSRLACALTLPTLSRSPSRGPMPWQPSRHNRALGRRAAGRCGEPDLPSCLTLRSLLLTPHATSRPIRPSKVEQTTLGNDEPRHLSSCAAISKTSDNTQRTTHGRQAAAPSQPDDRSHRLRRRNQDVWCLQASHTAPNGYINEPYACAKPTCAKKSGICHSRLRSRTKRVADIDSVKW